MIVLLYILIILLIGYSVTPLFFHSKGSVSFISEDEEEKLVTMKAEIYNFIKDLEYDYQEGKISENDYLTARNQLMEQAVAILKKLDGIKE